MKNRKLIILLIIIVAILIIALGGAIVYVLLQRNEGADNQIAANMSSNVVNNTISSNTVNTVTNEVNNTAVGNANQTAISTFNEMFISYAGDSKTDTQVITLLSIIDSSNTTNAEHKVNVSSAGITSSEELSSDKKYKVELAYDNDGYVNSVEITESTGTSQTGTVEEDIEKARFNNKFISFYGNGEITGENVKKLIEEILASNADNPEHQVAVKTDTLQGISDIVDTETYLIELSYDVDKWINVIVLNKKV